MKTFKLIERIFYAITGISAGIVYLFNGETNTVILWGVMTILYKLCLIENKIK